MRLILFLTVLCLLLYTTILAQSTEGTMEQFTLSHDDQDRTYLVYTPADYDDTQSHTLLLVLHPANTTAQQMADMTQFQSLADTNNMLMVFPNSVSGRWNSSGTFAIDDVGFITSLLDTVITNYTVDESNLFALGYSSGGLMTMKLRCALGDRLKGIISYAAPMTFAIANDCLTAAPVAALVIHGTADEVFPYSGQASVSGGELSGTFSADQTIGFLASLNGCQNQAQGQDISTENARNRVFVTRYPCEEHIAELYTIANLGHYGWAGQLTMTVDDESMTLNQAIFDFINRVGE